MLSFNNKIPMNKTLLTAFIIFCFSCTSSRSNKYGGVFNLEIRFLDKKTLKTDTVPWFVDFRHWFYDSMIIGEINHRFIATDMYEQTTIRDTPDHYTFIDLRKRKFTLFKNFSDTARPYKTYFQPDSGRAEGGWNFLSKLSDNIPLAYLSDTVFSGKKYELYYSQYKEVSSNSLKGRYHFLMKHDDKWWPLYFTLHFGLTEQTGRVIDRYVSEIPGDQLFMTTQYVPVSRTLTQKELKIFQAWKKKSDEVK
jgi:hypothetical protein